jgi:hypothetical protein
MKRSLKAGRDEADRHMAGTGMVKRAIATCAIAASMAFGSPLLDSTARAQAPPETSRPAESPRPAERAGAPGARKPTDSAKPAEAEKTEPAKYTVGGKQITIKDGEESREVYILARQTGLVPTVEVNGPATLEVRFYPAVLKDRFTEENPEYARTIQYSVGPAGSQLKITKHEGKTRLSGFTHPTEIQDPLVIGTPIAFTLKVGPGRQQFSVVSPNGLLEIVSATHIKVIAPPRPIAPPVPRVVAPPPLVEKPKPKAAEPAKEPLIELSGERLQLEGLGKDKGKGDIYFLDLMGHIPVRRGLSVLAGVSVTSYGQVLETLEARTSLRSISGNLVAGVDFTRAKHRLYAYGLIGFRTIMVDTQDRVDGRKESELPKSFEFGGALGYSFGHHFGLNLIGTNNPFNPIIASVHGQLPWGWVKGYKPYLAAHMLWLHAATIRESTGMIGAVDLKESEVGLRILAGLPLFRAGPVSLAAIAGTEMGISGTGVHGATGLFGGSVSAMFKNGLEISATGLSSIEGIPLVMFKMSYVR